MRGSPVDPLIVAVVTKAAGRTLERLIDLYVGKASPDADAEADKAIGRTYDKLRQGMPDSMVKILVILEPGHLLYPDMIRQSLYADDGPAPECLAAVDREFKYRLVYLSQLALVAPVAGGEYGITRLGGAFLREARVRRDYTGAVFSG
jgi:hypothetical protein